MKPFLGINLTSNKKNNQLNGKEFLVMTTSDAMSASLENSAKKATDTIEQSKIPFLFRIAQYICGVAALLITAGLLNSDVSFEEGYNNAPWLYWTAGVCALVWLLLWLWSKQKSKSILETDESAQTFSNLEGVTEAVYNELSVPANAKNADILSFFYKIKNGSIKAVEKGIQMGRYYNLEFKVFSDSNNLYIADVEGKYTIPLSCCKSLRTEKKHITLTGWNKEENLKHDLYKQYKLTADKYGCVHCKYYHILEVDQNGETYGIYIPCYELPVFEELTGLKAQSE